VVRVAGGPVAMVANLHLASSSATARVIEYPVPLVDVWRRLAPTLDLDIDGIDGGALGVPATAGLGVDPIALGDR
jgi:L-alanine-DL-glutamate epimerase-like enolase superfamily enzyme